MGRVHFAVPPYRIGRSYLDAYAWSKIQPARYDVAAEDLAEVKDALV